jgi:hypothetical protein
MRNITKTEDWPDSHPCAVSSDNGKIECVGACDYMIYRFYVSQSVDSVTEQKYTSMLTLQEIPSVKLNISLSSSRSAMLNTGKPSAPGVSLIQAFRSS